MTKTETMSNTLKTASEYLAEAARLAEARPYIPARDALDARIAELLALHEGLVATVAAVIEKG